MTVNDKEITAELVREFLNGRSLIGYKPMLHRIARAYLDKCEDLKDVVGENNALRGHNGHLQALADYCKETLQDATASATEMKKENKRLLDIIAKQTTRQYLAHHQTKDNTAFTPEEMEYLQESIKRADEENVRLQAIIEGQWSALNMALGFLEEVAPDSDTLIRVRQALALTAGKGE